MAGIPPNDFSPTPISGAAAAAGATSSTPADATSSLGALTPSSDWTKQHDGSLTRTVNWNGVSRVITVKGRTEAEAGELIKHVNAKLNEYRELAEATQVGTEHGPKSIRFLPGEKKLVVTTKEGKVESHEIKELKVQARSPGGDNPQKATAKKIYEAVIKILGEKDDEIEDGFSGASVTIRAANQSGVTGTNRQPHTPQAQASSTATPPARTRRSPFGSTVEDRRSADDKHSAAAAAAGAVSPAPPPRPPKNPRPVPGAKPSATSSSVSTGAEKEIEKERGELEIAEKRILNPSNILSEREVTDHRQHWGMKKTVYESYARNSSGQTNAEWRTFVGRADVLINELDRRKAAIHATIFAPSPAAAAAAGAVSATPSATTSSIGARPVPGAGGDLPDVKSFAAAAGAAVDEFTGLPKLADVLNNVYEKDHRPNKNGENLDAYSKSDDFRRHAGTARIYYNSDQLAGQDALRVIYQREPTNIAMDQRYPKARLREQFGYGESVYNENAVKANGHYFSAQPNTAAVYSETFMWKDPKDPNSKKEIACLSLPAPALDDEGQPHFNYYVQSGQLNEGRYREEIQFLFSTVEAAVRDNEKSAFQDRGIKRLVLSKFGQGAFLGAFEMNNPNRKVANSVFKTELHAFLRRMAKDHSEIEVVMAEKKPPVDGEDWLPEGQMKYGDIVQTCQEGDLIINAWDPHSAPGNGNDGDPSLDGAMGRGSGILLTQTAWFNPNLRKETSLAQVRQPARAAAAGAAAAAAAAAPAPGPAAAPAAPPSSPSVNTTEEDSPRRR